TTHGTSGLVVLVLVLVRLFFAVVCSNDLLVLFVTAGRGSLGIRELRLVRHFLDDSRAAAMRRDHGSFFGLALIGSALGADRLRFSEVVELRVATVAGIFFSQLRHSCKVSPGRKRRHLSSKKRAAQHAPLSCQLPTVTC